MKKNSDIFFVLDGMRGLAAVLIAMRHGSALLGGLDFAKSYLAVDLFFVLSGVVIVTAYEEKILAGMSFGQFAVKRFNRLFPMLMVGVSVGAAVGLATGQFTTATVWLHFFPSLVFLPNPSGDLLLFPLNGPMWSLFFEMVVNAIYLLGVRHVTGSRLRALLGAGAAMLILAALAYRSHQLDKGSTVNTMAIGLLRCLFSFYAGVLLARAYRAAGRPALAARHAGLATVAVLALSVGILMCSGRLPLGLWDLACILILFPALVFTAMRLRPTGRLRAFCGFSGAVSYPLYVIHEPVIRYCTMFSAAHADRLAGLATPASGVALIAALVAAAAVLDASHQALLRREGKTSSRALVAVSSPLE